MQYVFALLRLQKRQDVPHLYWSAQPGYEQHCVVDGSLILLHLPRVAERHPNPIETAPPGTKCFDGAESEMT
jgi:hypothetical protein